MKIITKSYVKTNIPIILVMSYILSGIAQERNKKEKSMNQMWGETTVSVNVLKPGVAGCLMKVTSRCLSTI